MTKKLLLLVLLFCFSIVAKSQCPLFLGEGVHNNVSCYGGANGSISINVSGGTSPYTYVWSGSTNNTNTLSSLIANNYTCYVSDSGTCNDSIVVIITQPDSLILNSTSSPSCWGGATGSITANATGGNPGGPFIGSYLYALSPPFMNFSPNNNFTNLSAGCYTVMVQDANTCTAYDNICVTQAPQSFSVSITTSQNQLNSCTDCITFNTNISGAPTSPVSYFWDGPCPNYTLFQSTVCGQCAIGTHTVTVTDSDACTGTATITITGPPPITNVTGAVKNDSCNMCVGDVHNLVVNGGTAPYVYLWEGPFNYNSTSQNVTNLCGGTYTLTVTDSLQCSYTQNFTSGNALNAFLNLNGSDPNCANTCTGTATANYAGPSAPYTYLWNSSPPQTGATATNLCPGNYTVTVTDNAGCMASAVKNIGVIPVPNLTPVSITHATCGMCNGIVSFANPLYYSLSIAGPNSYTNSASTYYSNLCAGTYTVYATRSGCTSYTNVFNIQLSSGAITGLTITPTITPETCPGSYDGGIDLSVSGGTAPYIFLWPNSIGEDIQNIRSGIYHFSMIDATGACYYTNYVVPASGIGCGNISGTVFSDLNTDCNMNLSDYGIGGSSVYISPGHYAYTNGNGTYTSIVPLGTYTLTHAANQQGYIANCNTTQTVTLTSISPNAIVNFSDTLNPISDIAVQYLSNDHAVPGFQDNLHFAIRNQSIFNSNPIDGEVRLVLKPDQLFQSANPSPAIIIGDTLIWNFSSLAQYQSYYYDVNILMTANVSLLGTNLTNCIYTNTSNTTDQVSYNNNTCRHFLVTGAFDPNDKSVSPAGNITLADSTLTYTIRFQNTGNGPAVNVFVIDTISQNLDLSTFKILGSSHNYNVSFTGGNICKFNFPNIMLPDSNSNEPGSHGWIQYSIKQSSSNQYGDVINNTAYIYFDFNPPVVTNTTKSSLVNPIGIKKSPSFTSVAFPNPTTNKVQLKLVGIKGSSEISLFNSNGILVKNYTKHLTNESLETIDMNGLSSGIYLLIIKNNGEVRTIKLVKM